MRDERRVLLLLLSISVCILTVMVSQVQVVTAQVANYTVTVTANPLWTDTGIRLDPSQTVIIHDATGVWNAGLPNPSTGPDGLLVDCSWAGVSEDEWITDCHHGQLIGFVGANPNVVAQNNPALFVVGTGTVTLTGQSGELWLGFNDDFSSGAPGVADNFGSVTVTVTVQLSQLSLDIHSGNNQTGIVLEALPQPLVVQVTDQSGNPPTTNVPITFSVTQQPTGVQTNAVLSNPNTTVQSGSTTASTDLILGDAGGTYQVTASCASCTPQSVTFTERACPVDPSSVHPFASGPYSLDGNPTSMTATFTPTDVNGNAIGLLDAARACGFQGFNWVQTVTADPYPLMDSTCRTTLSVPYPDPPPGGYCGTPDSAWPFYWNQAELSTGQSPCDSLTIQTNTTLRFSDCPAESRLMPPQFLAFHTKLVGVVFSNGLAQPVDMGIDFIWTDDFNGTVLGGGSARKNLYPVDPGSGTGGITITSLNGVPQMPPSVSCTATPNTLWPPNGKSVAVTVSGSITPGTQAIPPSGTTYAVTDEYGQVQPTGSIALDAGGSYSFQVPLIAARDGNDRDGRTYTISVRGRDTLGNVGSCSAVVTVPHDQGH